MHYTITVVLALIISGLIAQAGEEIPGAKQRMPIALTNGIVHTASGPTLPSATVVFDNGRLTAIGPNAKAPANARVIDCKGKHIYPGFIAPHSTLGLVEIDAVRATRDIQETGQINPNARAETAYNPDSELIPTVRSNGILIVNSVPSGGHIAGQSSIMRMDGWTREDIAIKPVSAIVLDWPQMNIISSWWMTKSAEEQRKEIEISIKVIEDVFADARAYSASVRAGDTARRDIRYEALRPVFEENVPVMISASTRKQIEAVLDFRLKFDVKIILVGASDAPLLIPQIQRAGVPIILPRVHSLPRHDEDAYDAPFTLPQALIKANIPFAFSDGGSWQQRNLPFQAGTARAFGLSEDDAVRGLTIMPAQIFGIDADYGSLEIGKSATLFVSTGDALDARTIGIEYAFIDGREVSLDNRHKRLAKKYRQRSKQ